MSVHRNNLSDGVDDKALIYYVKGYEKARAAVAKYSSNEFVTVDPKVRCELTPLILCQIGC